MSDPALNSSLYSNWTADWGPRRDPLIVVIPITIVYVLTFVTGTVGNVSTCIVIARNKAMHTATNYYLFSLAISDLLLLISGLPPEIYSVWSKYPYVFGEAFCVLQGFAAETSANATVLTITAFTVERYLAICHPFVSHTFSSLSRAVRFVVAIWLLAMCLAVPQALAFGVVQAPDDEHQVCIVKRLLVPHAFLISTFAFFVLPMAVITVLYALIGRRLREGGARTGRRGLDESEEEARRTMGGRNVQGTRHVVKMLIAVVVAFFICWAPFHAQRLLAIYGKQPSANMIKTFQILTYISGIFYYLSTTVNPLLYHIMSHKFREAFKATFKQCFGRAHHPDHSKRYSTLSGRSSQNNSHSDSCSRQSSLRYLDAEMARLHDSRRPLVVSFRKKRPTGTGRRPIPTNGLLGRRLDLGKEEALPPVHVCPMRKGKVRVVVKSRTMPVIGCKEEEREGERAGSVS